VAWRAQVGVDCRLQIMKLVEVSRCTVSDTRPSICCLFVCSNCFSISGLNMKRMKDHNISQTASISAVWKFV
jgi:hypothetical protein